MNHEHIFDLYLRLGHYHHYSPISLNDDESMLLYRVTFGVDKESPVDLSAITAEEFRDMEQALALCLLEAFENNDTMLEPIYEWLGDAA